MKRSGCNVQYVPNPNHLYCVVDCCKYMRIELYPWKLFSAVTVLATVAIRQTRDETRVHTADTILLCRTYLLIEWITWEPSGILGLPYPVRDSLEWTCEWGLCGSFVSSFSEAACHWLATSLEPNITKRSNPTPGISAHVLLHVKQVLFPSMCVPTPCPRRVYLRCGDEHWGRQWTSMLEDFQL